MSLELYDHANPPNRMAGEEGFKDKTLLLTGGSGFLGKVFIEKLLRTVSTVKRIYVIIRTKKGKDPQARLKDIFSGPLFDLLKKLRGEEVLNKVVPVSGDLGEPGLGISPEDRKLLAAEVQIILHLAATTRFDEPFKRAVLFNARGTKFMLDLAKECKKLQIFIHCSTAYCYPQEEVLYERVYDPPADPELIINICQTLDDEVIEAMSKILMRNCPNTYTYSKSLAEGIVREELNNLPIAIVRPSVVIPIWKEPLPGWTENLYGPTGLLIAAGKGILRTVYCDPKAFLDFVPVDIVANALICIVWYQINIGKTHVYNLTSTSEFQITWGEVINIGREIACGDMPLNWVVWYPGGSMKTSRLAHEICLILFQYIPAIFLDALIVLTGNKPVVWKVNQKIIGGFELMEYYAHKKWVCSSEQAIKARKELNETEKKIYKLDKDGLVPYDYFHNAAHGARLYLLKESDETLPTARRHIKVMWAVDRIFRLLMIIGLIYLFYNYLVCPLLTYSKNMAIV